MTKPHNLFQVAAKLSELNMGHVFECFTLLVLSSPVRYRSSQGLSLLLEAFSWERQETTINSTLLSINSKDLLIQTIHSNTSANVKE